MHPRGGGSNVGHNNPGLALYDAERLDAVAERRAVVRLKPG